MFGLKIRDMNTLYILSRMRQNVGMVFTECDSIIINVINLLEMIVVWLTSLVEGCPDEVISVLR